MALGVPAMSRRLIPVAAPGLLALFMISRLKLRFVKLYSIKQRFVRIGDPMVDIYREIISSE